MPNSSASMIKQKRLQRTSRCKASVIFIYAFIVYTVKTHDEKTSAGQMLRLFLAENVAL